MIPFLLLTALALQAPATPAELVRPENYREWVFLSSGLGMTYGPAAAMSAHPMFDTVFVEPAAWKAFRATGRWPEKAVFILEIRASSSHGSINQAGYFPTDVVGIEAAVKDSRFAGGWGYFDFASTAPGQHAPTAKVLPPNASCYACHKASGAVENTFTQFYPAALEIAERKGTLNPTYPRPAPTPAKFFAALIADGWEKSVQVLEVVHAQGDPLTSEASLNQLGYQLLAAKQPAHAVALLEWTTRTYPRSANAFDSLAEVLTAAGETQRAATAGARACALLPADTSLDAARRQALEKNCASRQSF